MALSVIYLASPLATVQGRIFSALKMQSFPKCSTGSHHTCSKILPLTQNWKLPAGWSHMAALTDPTKYFGACRQHSPLLQSQAQLPQPQTEIPITQNLPGNQQPGPSLGWPGPADIASCTRAYVPSLSAAPGLWLLFSQATYPCTWDISQSSLASFMSLMLPQARAA